MEKTTGHRYTTSDHLDSHCISEVRLSEKDGIECEASPGAAGLIPLYHGSCISCGLQGCQHIPGLSGQRSLHVGRDSTSYPPRPGSQTTIRFSLRQASSSCIVNSIFGLIQAPWVSIWDAHLLTMIGIAGFVQTAACRKLSVEGRLHRPGHRLETAVRHLVG